MEGRRDPEAEGAAPAEGGAGASAAASGAAEPAAIGAADPAAGRTQDGAAGGAAEDASPLGAIAAMRARGAKGSKGPTPEVMDAVGVSTTMTAEHTSLTPAHGRVVEEVLVAGSRVGRYEVRALLGRGGMGTVYRARDLELGRDVALKCLDSERLGIEETRARLRREARAMARVEHAGVVRIYDVSSEGAQLFVAMELCTGGTLAEWLSGQRRGWRQIVAVFAGAGHGLAALHRAGLIHRDIKPGNLLLDERGQAKVTDFGLARPPHPASGAERAAEPAPEQDEELELAEITRVGGLVGTPAYMAPEQLAREPLDARADQFSFCVALWEALCGRRPFDRGSASGSAQTPREILRAIDQGAEAAPGPGPGVAVPRRVLALVRRGLARNPAARWASMEELVAALERAARWPHRLLVLALAAGVLAAGAALVLVRLGAGGGAGEPASSASQLKELQVVARAVDQHLAVTMLRDARYVYLKRGELSVGAASGEGALALASPPGLRPFSVQRSGAAGWVVVRAHQQGKGCSWWHAPLAGGAWRPLLTDEACAEPLDVAVAPGGAQLAIGDGQGIRIRALAADDAGAPRRLLEGTAVWTLAWSPDGTRLAASTGRDAVVVELASGAQRPLRGAVARGDVWLDANRLMYLGSRNYLHSQLRLLDLRSGTDVAALELDGIVEQVDATAQGIMVFRREPHSLLYSTPVPTAAPPALDGLRPLETGSTIDFLPAGWTADGSVISLSLVGGRRGLVRSRAGERGEPLLLHQTAGINLTAATADKIFYTISRGPGLGPGRGQGRGIGREQRVFEISSGRDVQWNEGAAARPTSMSCAQVAGRCVVIGEKENTWLDLKTMQLTPVEDVGWRFEPFEELSPDAAQSARLRGDAVVLRALADGAETIVTPQPALVGLAKVWWSRDGETLLLIAKPRMPGDWTGSHQVVRLSRDGRWQVLLKDSLRSFDGVLLSPGEDQIAFTAQLNKLTWSTWGWRAGASR